jgi:hypothetical protein
VSSPSPRHDRARLELESDHTSTPPRTCLPRRGPHAKAGFQAYLKPPPPPGRASGNPSRPCAPAPSPARTLARRRCCSPPPLPLRRREVIPELRKEVRSSLVPLVVVPVHRVTDEGSPELHRCTAPPHRAAHRPRRVLADRATLDVFVASCASSRCDPRAKPSPPARSRAAPAVLPPFAAGQALACVRSRQIKI